MIKVDIKKYYIVELVNIELLFCMILYRFRQNYDFNGKSENFN